MRFVSRFARFVIFVFQDFLAAGHAALALCGRQWWRYAFCRRQPENAVSASCASSDMKFRVLGSAFRVCGKRILAGFTRFQDPCNKSRLSCQSCLFVSQLSYGCISVSVNRKKQSSRQTRHTRKEDKGTRKRMGKRGNG